MIELSQSFSQGHPVYKDNREREKEHHVNLYCTMPWMSERRLLYVSEMFVRHPVQRQ